MASIVKRGKTYSVVYYEGEGSNRHQVWESGLSYSAAKSRKATIEYEKEQNTHVDHNDITVSEFLYEFIEKYGEKKWVASTYGPYLLGKLTNRCPAVGVSPQPVGN